MIAANIATQCACSGPCTLDVSPISPELCRDTFFSSVPAFRVHGATVEPLLFLHHQPTLTSLSFPTELKFRRTFDTCLQLPHSRSPSPLSFLSSPETIVCVDSLLFYS